MTNPDPFLNEMQEWVELTMRNSMHSLIRSNKRRGFSMTESSALFSLRHKSGCGVGEMAEHLGISNAAASQMLDRLVEQGLISRSEDPNDRRGKRIVLTDQGNELIKEGMKARQSWVVDMVALFTPEQVALVLPVLQLLIEKTRELEFGQGFPCAHFPTDTTK